MGKKKKEKALSVIAEDVSALSVLEQEGLAVPQVFARDILLMETIINGAMHVENIHALAAALHVGDRVKLILEPDNPVDARAILVRNEKDEKLGYIPRVQNEVLFHLMDAGKYLYGVVVDGDIDEDADEEDTWVQIYIEVYMKD